MILVLASIHENDDIEPKEAISDEYINIGSVADFVGVIDQNHDNPMPSLNLISTLDLKGFFQAWKEYAGPKAKLPSIRLTLESFDSAISCWVRNHESEPIPPLPNLTIQLPSGMTISSFIDINENGASSLFDRADKNFTCGWITTHGKKGDFITYGVSGNSMSLARKELFDREKRYGVQRFACYANGTIHSNPRELDAEHIFSKKHDPRLGPETFSIHGNIWRLIDSMNRDLEFAESICDSLGSFCERYIVKPNKSNTLYSPTKYFIRDYFNDIQNLFLMKSDLNQDKGNRLPSDYFSGNDFYLGFLPQERIDTRGIIQRYSNENGCSQGLGDAAFLHFHSNHAWYRSLLTLDFEISVLLNEKAHSLKTEKQAIDEISDPGIKKIARNTFEKHNRRSELKRITITDLIKTETPVSSDKGSQDGDDQEAVNFALLGALKE